MKIVGAYLDGLTTAGGGGGGEQGGGDNGATRLLRQALGRGKSTVLSFMLSLPEHKKRDYHDDITVTVIYFHHDGDNIALESKL